MRSFFVYYVYHKKKLKESRKNEEEMDKDRENDGEVHKNETKKFAKNVTCHNSRLFFNISNRCLCRPHRSRVLFLTSYKP